MGKKKILCIQVRRACSYLYHLIALEQQQRSALYNFAEHLKNLNDCMSTIKNLFADSTVDNIDCLISSSRHVTFKCMWQQKVHFYLSMLIVHNKLNLSPLIQILK